MKITIEIDQMNKPEVQVSSDQTNNTGESMPGSVNMFDKANAIDAGPAPSSLQMKGLEQTNSISEQFHNNAADTNTLSAGAAPR